MKYFFPLGPRQAIIILLSERERETRVGENTFIYKEATIWSFGVQEKKKRRRSRKKNKVTL